MIWDFSPILFYYSVKPVTVTVNMEENDGTQTAVASLVKLSSAASPVKFSVSVFLVKLLYLRL